MLTGKNQFIQREIVAALKENGLKEIAAQTGYSIVTVKRALGNYPGVSGTAKQEIIATAQKLGYHRKIEPVDVGIVIPSIPTFFWGIMCDSLMTHARLAAVQQRFFFFSNIDDEADALHCLKTATEHGVKVLIAAVPNTPRVCSLLEQCARECCVILLEEHADVKNAYYVGENAYKESRALAKAYFRRWGTQKSVFVFRYRNGCDEKRIQGFLDGARDCGAKEPVLLCLNQASKTKARAALVARLIQEYEQEIDCIYCPSGNANTVDEAVKKLRTNRDIHIIGFDNVTILDGNAAHDRIKLMAWQDLQEQSRIAIKTAAEFITTGKLPEEKNLFVADKSIIHLD